MPRRLPRPDPSTDRRFGARTIGLVPSERVVATRHAVDLALTFRPLQRGTGDPTMRITPVEVLRATRTPDGPGTTRLTRRAGGVRIQAWGQGAEWLCEHAGLLVGDGDGVETFAPRDGRVAEVARRFEGLRITKTAAVFEALVPTICEQKVKTIDARRCYRLIVNRFGEPAPGPFRLALPPDPATLASLPYWTFHRLGIERMRADAIRRSASVAHQLEECASLPVAAARRRLGSVPGVGPWSVAEVGLVALGDADAVPLGDVHIPHLVSWHLAGIPRGDDALMLELLEPYRGHRGRVIRLLAATGEWAPRYAPRMSRQNLADFTSR